MTNLVVARSISNSMMSLMVAWHEGKLFVERAVPINHDSLHLIFGGLIWLGSALVMGKKVHSWRPWVLALAIIVWNEAIDLTLEQWPDPAIQSWEGIKDIFTTMLIPTLMLAISMVVFKPSLD